MLIGVGLTLAYLILGGKFPPKSTAVPVTTQPGGSGGESFQSSFTQLGHSLAMHSSDLRASQGGMK
jgi:hypothetical protein